MRRVDVDLPAVIACADRYHRAVVGGLMDLRAGLRAGLLAGGIAHDDEHADAITEAALWKWAIGEGAVTDQCRAAAAEALGIVTEAETHTRAARRPFAPRRRYYVVPSVHVPERCR